MILIRQIIFLIILPTFLFSQQFNATGLNGTYSVGPGGAYSNLTDALIAANSGGVSGPVIFELTANYTSSGESYPITIGDINGLSEINTLTVRPELNAFDLTISGTGTSTLRLYKTKYVIIDGRAGGTGNTGNLTIENTNLSGSALELIEDTRFSQIKYCILKGKNNIQNRGVVSILYGTFTGVNDNLITNCEITCINSSELPLNGIYIGGDYIAGNHNNTVSKCEINNFNENGILVTGNSISTIIEDCSIYHIIPSTAMDIRAVTIEDADSTIVRRNKIYGIHASLLNYSVKGIYLSLEFGVNQSSFISNNFIALNTNNESNNAEVYGIDYYNEDTSGFFDHNVTAVYNSIWIGGDDDYGRSSYGVSKRSFADNFTLLNNIFVNTRNTLSCPGKQYCLYFPDTIGNINCNYNNLYTGDVNVYGNWGGAALYTFEDWRNLSLKDLNSVSKPVLFTGRIDLHLSGTSLGDMDLAGIYLPEFPYDIDNELRGPNPYMGADENLEFPLPAELVSFSASYNGESVNINWSTASELNNKGFYIERKFNNQLLWETAGFVPGSGTSSNIKFYSFSDNPFKEGIYSYRLKQVDYDGTFDYSEELLIEVVKVYNYSLEQNYPNPFNPSTQIRYSLAEDCHIELRIYDMLGEEVEVLINEEQAAGTYNLEFIPSQYLASGIYLYELKTNNFSSIRKMIFLR